MTGMADDVSSSVSSFSLLNFTSTPPAMALGSLYAPWILELKSDERGLLLIHLLLNCATHVDAGRLDQSNAVLEYISLLSSPSGDTMQRIASYFSEALSRRLLRSWPGLYLALNSDLADSAAASATAARRVFVDLCPFLRLSYLVSNQAILESMEGEKVVHILDLGGSDVVQWLALLQALADRPEGPPHLRITSVSEHRDSLSHTASILSTEAEKLDIPFQFHAVVSRLDALDVESLRVKTGEALAIVSVRQLHSLLSSSDDATQRKHFSPHSTGSISQKRQRMTQFGGGCGSLGEILEKDHGFSGSDSPCSSFKQATSAKMESFLASLFALSPKLMVVTEPEANHNGSIWNERFVEALNYYAAVFDCLESTVPRESTGRMTVEKMLFREEILNIIACEGSERRARHEKLDCWMQRMESAGFGRVGLSYYALLQARRMLQAFSCDGYKVKEVNGCFLLCWQERALFSVSAWRFRRYG